MDNLHIWLDTMTRLGYLSVDDLVDGAYYNAINKQWVISDTIALREFIEDFEAQDWVKEEKKINEPR